MWLLDAKIFKLKEYLSEDNLPRYNILSHRWIDGEEISFQEMRASGQQQSKRGIVKIQYCCKQALVEGVQYVWIDTCCIDKTSSTELSEAINSMYRWYAKAVTCYAYLVDVKASDPDSFGESEWFTRGWTLQELIAPVNVVFFDKTWDRLGTRYSLRRDIELKTGIDSALLRGDADPKDYAIAERMFWASKRKTTRVEDRAYSLLGLFGINIPLLYGEGDRAFLRLQEEIIKYSNDHTIFSWPLSAGYHGSLLAPLPFCFHGCSGVKIFEPLQEEITTFSMTNRGLQIRLWLTQWSIDTYLASLNCAFLKVNMSEPKKSDKLRLGILVRPTENRDQYIRVAIKEDSASTSPYSLVELGDNITYVFDEGTSRRLTITIPQVGLSASRISIPKPVLGFQFGPGIVQYDYRDRQLFTINGLYAQFQKWNAQEQTLTTEPGYPFNINRWVFELDITSLNKKVKHIKVAFDFSFNPICFLAESAAVKELTLSAEDPRNFYSEWKSKQDQVHNRQETFRNRFLTPQEQRAQQPMTQAEWDRFHLAHLRKSNKFSENQFTGKPFSQRYASDINSFSERERNKITSERGTFKFAHKHELREGLWMLQGSRESGLHVKLEGLGDGRKKDARLILEKVEVSGALVWALDIRNLACDEPEKRSRSV